MNNVGLPELGILGIIALLFLGGSRLAKKPAAKQKKTAVTDTKQTDIMANFQNVNTDYEHEGAKKRT